MNVDKAETTVAEAVLFQERKRDRLCHCAKPRQSLQEAKHTLAVLEVSARQLA